MLAKWQGGSVGVDVDVGVGEREGITWPIPSVMELPDLEREPLVKNW